MGPDELDDLLASIRAEGKRETALALYEGTRETDLVDEEVDDRVLRLIGLDDVFDIDYGTYISLLRERLEASRSFGKKISTEEDELLVNEFRKVKGKVGRFKIKPKKISADAIVTTGPIRVNNNKFILADRVKTVDSPEEEKTTSDSKNLVLIEKTLSNIVKVLEKQQSERKKALEKERQRKEREARKRKEALLEKSLGAVKSITQKILAPVQSIWDRIVNFLQNVVMGLVATRLFRWFTDPKNENKIKTLARFLKDWWPALAFAAGLFLTPLGKFIRTTLTLLRTWAPAIATFLKANPWVLGITAATIGGIAKIKESERMNPLTQKSQAEIDKTLKSKDAPWYQKLGASFAGQSLNAPGGPKNPIGLSMPGSMYSGGGRVRRDNTIDINDIAFEGGGGISKDTGLKIKGAGSDTQLIAAKPGEVVISKEAVDKYGANFFLGLNKSGGGTNIPKMVNNIQLARGGGIVGKVPSTPEYKHPSVKAALKTLRFTEGTHLDKNPYNVVFGGASIPITKMTVKELINTQMTDVLPKRFGGGRAPFASGSVASGAYQFMPNTLRQLITMKVLKPTDIMTPENQDKAGWALMKNRGVTIQSLKKQGFSRVTQDMLSGEWASVPTMSGQSAYGQPVKPSAKIQEFYKKTLDADMRLKPSSNRTSFIKLPPKIQKIAMGNNMPQPSTRGTGVPAFSSEDPNFAYDRSRSFYQGIINEPVA